MEDGNVQEIKTILVSIGKLETNTENISNQMKDVLKLVSEVPAYNESVKTAHKRITDIELLVEKSIAATERLIEAKDAAQDERISKLEDSQKWLGRSVAGAIVLAVLDKFLF